MRLYHACELWLCPFRAFFILSLRLSVFSHSCEKLELCDCTSVIVVFIGAVIVPGVRQSGETLPYIYTKLWGISLSIHAEKFGENLMYHLCITEIISVALNDRLFLLVMICRRRWPPRQQSPLLIYRDFWAFGHDFSKNLQLVHDDSLLCIVSTPENYLL